MKLIMQIPRSTQKPSQGAGGMAGIIISVLLIVIFDCVFVAILSYYDSKRSSKSSHYSIIFDINFIWSVLILCS